ncbi:hypothetical protein ONZ45_g1930 [Pleurotus djamor]|nr:hypothetical protein ONZ45_g1930 [Pleurotus djamor]
MPVLQSRSYTERPLNTTAVTCLTIASFIFLVTVAATLGHLLRKRNARRRATSARRSLILSRIQRSQLADMNGGSMVEVNSPVDDDMQHVGFEVREKDMNAIYDDYVRDQGGLSR